MTDAETSADINTPAVLVIDDEDYVADMIASMLRLEGFETQTAYNGREGMEAARKFQGVLIIVDIMMPYMNGFELVEHLRAEHAVDQVPIILISAGARPRRSLANVAFLAKPFDLDQLLTLVHQLT